MKSKRELTLDRLLSRYGACSRTAARDMIQAGRVRVNGRIERDPARWLQPGRDQVQLDGARLRPERRIYLAFYKPKGVIVSHGDPAGRRTIYDCLSDYRDGRAGHGAGLKARAGVKAAWLAPVGRLDKDTSGLLLVTNDTEFAHFVSSPASAVPKTYRVKLSGLMSDPALAQLRSGVRMKRGDEARPLAVRRLEDRGKYTWLEIVLTEGKNREVLPLVSGVGFFVLFLVRSVFGRLSLYRLVVGGARTLTAADIGALRRWRPSRSCDKFR